MNDSLVVSWIARWRMTKVYRLDFEFDLCFGRRDGRRNSTIVERIYQAQYCNPSLLNRTGSVRSMGGWVHLTDEA